MIRKKVILNTYREQKQSYLDTITLLRALEKQGFKTTKRGLSNFIRHSLENKYLVSSKNPYGVITGWRLIRTL